MSAATTSHGFLGILWCIICSFGYICWNSRFVEHFLYIFQYCYLLIPSQYIDSRTRSFVFSIPIWFIWSCCSTCFCNVSGITVCLPFRMTPSITAMSSWNVQYGLGFCGILSLFSCHPLWCVLSVVLNDCLELFHIAVLVLSYILGCLWLFLQCQHSLACHLFLHPCLLYGFVWITSMQWIDLDKACILFWLHIGVFWGVFAVVFAIMLPHLSWILPPAACGL